MEFDVYKEWLGIPDGQRPPDHYQLLRLVQFEDAVDKIRTNYKKLNSHVRKYATGKYSLESQELLNELAKAMLCLTDAGRKKEYDQTLGREFEDERGLFGGKSMEVNLLDKQVISKSQLEEAREYSQKSGLEMRDALVQLKLVDPAVAAQALAEELGLPYVDLADMLPDDDVLDRVPRDLVKQNSILPLFIDNDTLLVACVHLPSPELEEELRFRFNVPLRGVLATPLAINQGIAKYYAPGSRKEVVEDVKSPRGKKAAKSTSTGTAKKQQAAPLKRMSQLTPEAAKQRKTMGLLIMCWSVIFSVVVDQMVVPTSWLMFKQYGLFVFFVPPIAIAWVFWIYWKE